jgi:hypothetical protein
MKFPQGRAETACMPINERPERRIGRIFAIDEIAIGSASLHHVRGEKNREPTLRLYFVITLADEP